MDLFRLANFLEAALWGMIGLGFAVAAIRGRGAPGRMWSAALLFVAFGLSDVVEVRTGAWWDPGWMFAWKAACIAGLLGLLAWYVRCRRAVRSRGAK